MKANDFILVASVFAALLSCTREPLPSRQIGPSSFSATLDEATKSIIDGTTGKWTDGDAIALYSGGQNTGVVYSTSLAEPSTSAVFSGSGAVQAADGKYYAIYPASAISGNWYNGTEGSKYNEGNARVEVPSEQHPASCGYDPTANIMCASSSSTSFTFHHLVGYVKFTIGPSSPKNIVKVIVTERNGKAIAAKTFAKTNLEFPSLEVLSGSNSEVAFKNSDDSPLAEGTYYIAMIPRTFSQGLTFYFNTSDSRYSDISTTEGISLTRGQIQNIGTVRNLVLKSIPAVGDVYKENEVAKGVVVRVDNESSKAYVMSLTDIEIQSWDSSVSACSNYGTVGWHMMSKDDWDALHALYNFKTSEGRDTINELLSQNGGSGITDNVYYWTSTVPSDKTKASCVKIKASDSTYSSGPYSKTGTRPARAMLTLTF